MGVWDSSSTGSRVPPPIPCGIADKHPQDVVCGQSADTLYDVLNDYLHMLS